MQDRPFEFVFYALKMRLELLKIINDKYLFCLANPEFYMNKILDIVGDILKRFKSLQPGKDTLLAEIVRNVAFGIPAGADDLKTYKKWSKIDHD